MGDYAPSTSAEPRRAGRHATPDTHGLPHDVDGVAPLAERERIRVVPFPVKSRPAPPLQRLMRAPGVRPLSRDEPRQLLRNGQDIPTPLSHARPASGLVRPRQRRVNGADRSSHRASEAPATGAAHPAPGAVQPWPLSADGLSVARSTRGRSSRRRPGRRRHEPAGRPPGRPGRASRARPGSAGRRPTLTARRPSPPQPSRPAVESQWSWPNCGRHSPKNGPTHRVRKHDDWGVTLSDRPLCGNPLCPVCPVHHRGWLEGRGGRSVDGHRQ